MISNVIDVLTEKRFATLADVDGYLGGERVECLICGKAFKALGRHIFYVHGVTAKSYRMALNIPRSRLLMGTRTRELYSEVQKTEKNRALLTNPELRRRGRECQMAVTPQVVPLSASIITKAFNDHVGKLKKSKTSRLLAEALDALHLEDKSK
jgi:hypothetical protein